MTESQKIIMLLVDEMRDIDMMEVSELSGYEDDALEEIYEDLNADLNDLHAFIRDKYFKINA